MKALEEAIQEIAKLTAQFKIETRLARPQEDKAEKKFMIVRDSEDSPRKPLSDEQKAAAEKLRARVKKLAAELEAKSKELAETKAKLAKIEGTHHGTAMVILRSGQPDIVKHVVNADVQFVDLHREPIKTMVTTLHRVQQVDGKGRVITERIEELARPQGDKPKTAEVSGFVKRIDPTKRRVEISIGSDALVKPGKPIEIKTDHPVSARVKVPVRSEQQRIEELERTLKKLIGEVENLKKDRPRTPEDR